MLRSGCTKSGWLMRWPDHLRATVPRMSSASSASSAPERIGPRRSVSSSENRHARTAPSAVMRSRLQVSQKGSETEEMVPMPPGAPSANR